MGGCPEPEAARAEREATQPSGVRADACRSMATHGLMGLPTESLLVWWRTPTMLCAAVTEVSHYGIIWYHLSSALAQIGHGVRAGSLHPRDEDGACYHNGDTAHSRSRAGYCGTKKHSAKQKS